MQAYEAIQQQVQRNRLEHSIRVAELISDVIATTWQALAYAAGAIAAAHRTKNPDRIFTFEA